MRCILRTVAICLLAVASASPGQIDHRPSQSPVKNQGARGTCVAFAICAAMEVFPGVPGDLSEQTTYAAVKLHQNSVDRWLRALGKAPSISAGDQFSTYARLASILGTCAEAFLPYNPNPVRVPADAPPEVRRFAELAQADPAAFDRFRSAMGKYRIPEESLHLLSGAQARDIERLKRELDAGRLAIPVIYRVHGDSWSDPRAHAHHDGDGVRDIIHPGMMHLFKPPGQHPLSYPDARTEAARRGVDFVRAVQEGEWLATPAFPAGGYGGHAVAVTGYDERGFHIKNSWGAGWGRQGYARIAFDYHAIYATEALLVDRVSIQPPDPSPLEKAKAIREADWRLKIQPGRAGPPGSPAALRPWTLSVWAHEPREPDCEIVEYRIETGDRAGAWREILRRTVAAGPAARRSGAPLPLDARTFALLSGSERVRVTVRFGDFPLGPEEGPESARYLAERMFGPVVPANLRSALDLPPAK